MVRTFIAGAVLLALGAPVVAQDADGSDHPLLPRYEGADIRKYRAGALDETLIPIGAITSEGAKTSRRKLEGTITHIDYRVKPATAPLQIERHYKGVLQAAGFETVYNCVGAACGRDMGSLILNSGKVAPVGFADGLFNDRIRVLVARSGDSWVLLHIAEGPDRSQVYQLVVEEADTATS